MIYEVDEEASKPIQQQQDLVIKQMWEQPRPVHGEGKRSTGWVGEVVSLSLSRASYNSRIIIKSESFNLIPGERGARIADCELQQAKQMLCAEELKLDWKQ